MFAASGCFYFLLLPRCYIDGSILFNGPESTCISNGAHCTEPVFVSLHHTEGESGRNTQAKWWNSLDTLYGFLKQEPLKGLRWPGRPCASVCVFARVYGRVDRAVYCFYSRTFIHIGGREQGVGGSWYKATNRSSAKNNICSNTKYFILPLGVLLNGTKTSE